MNVLSHFNTKTILHQKNEADINMKLQFANNIMSHLNRLIESEAKIEYINNRMILDTIIFALIKIAVPVFKPSLS